MLFRHTNELGFLMSGTAQAQPVCIQRITRLIYAGVWSA
jgi:hypothetical protein